MSQIINKSTKRVSILLLVFVLCFEGFYTDIRATENTLQEKEITQVWKYTINVICNLEKERLAYNICRIITKILLQNATVSFSLFSCHI